MLIVETGEGLKNSNSYVTLDEAEDYLTARDIAFEESELKSKVILACDYLAFAGFNFKGKKVSFEQSLDFPRVGVFVGDLEIPSDSIPQQIKVAQLELLKMRIEKPQLFELMSFQDFIIKEKIDVIETQYASPSEALEMQNQLKSINNMLLVFLLGSGGQMKVFRG